MSIKRQKIEPAKHSHYVSLSNDCIYPAMTHDSGYEDRNPADWRPATPDEVARYKAGDSSATAFEEISFDLSDSIAPSAPAQTAPTAPAPAPVPPPAPFAPPPPAAAPTPFAPPPASMEGALGGSQMGSDSGSEG